MKQILLILFLIINTIAYSQNNTILKTSDKSFKGGFGIYPNMTNARIGYRSNLQKKWTFDFKFGYNFTVVPLFNIELNAINRHSKNEVFSFYNGYGITLDGITPGLILPLGFEIKPFPNYKNIIFVVEASPKITLSFSAGVNSSLTGNFGIILFKPKNQK